MLKVSYEKLEDSLAISLSLPTEDGVDLGDTIVVHLSKEEGVLSLSRDEAVKLSEKLTYLLSNEAINEE
jgi:hypothetical protein